MSEHHIPKTPIRIGGKDRHLTFDFNAICSVSQQTGINLLQASVSNVEPQNLRALLLASLLHEDPTLTLEQVGAWIGMKNLADVRAKIMTAWFEAVDDGEDKPEGDAAPGEAPAQM